MTLLRCKLLSPPPPPPTGSCGAPLGIALHSQSIYLPGPPRARSGRPIRVHGRATADGARGDDDDVVSGRRQKCGRRRRRRGGLRRCEGGRGGGVVHFSRTLLPLYTRSIARTQQHADGARVRICVRVCVCGARARLPSHPTPTANASTHYTHAHTRATLLLL